MAGALKHLCGGILALVELIDGHRAAFEYDWRNRFHIGLDSVGDTMSWAEAYRLTSGLSADPSSYIAASVSGWNHPISREALVLMDLFDLQYAAHAGGRKRPKPYPRPWPDRTKQHAKPTVSQEVVLAALREAGHNGPLPQGAA